MATSDLLQRHLEEHNTQVRAAQSRLSSARAALTDIETAFEEHERATRVFHRQITDRVKVLIATAERDVADLGSAIDTLEMPSPNGQTTTLVDLTGRLRGDGGRG